ncbi:YbaN family protein [Neisseriaceae bacterium B1]
MMFAWQEVLFWAMSAALFVIPMIMVALLPDGRHKELLLRSLLGLNLMVLGIVLILAAVSPQWLPHSASLGAYTFWVLTALLIVIPISFVFALPKSKLRTTLINGILWLVGAIALVLGVIGAVLPVMPTTPFILVTAACWGRASPRFHRWLHNHRYFGPMVRNWEERRAIPKRGKYLAWTMMSLSCIGLLWRFPERWYVGVGTSIVCLCVGLWMAKLPNA